MVQEVFLRSSSRTKTPLPQKVCRNHTPSTLESYANLNIGGHLALGFIVLIGLAIALALIFLIVVAGILAERIRRKREGYIPAPTNMYDKASQISRLPPEQLFGTVRHGRSAAIPTI